MLENTSPSVLSTSPFRAENIEKYRQSFNEATPYRHLVIDNFLEDDFAHTLQREFPTVDALKTHWKGLNEQKSEGSTFDTFHPAFGQLRDALASPNFYKWIESVTGIEDVFITDDQMGAGIHQGADGSFLDVHIDFNIHHLLNVHRRLNLLIYLEKDWKDAYGGGLELWNADMTKCEKVLMPALNRAVIFETSEISYHGYDKISLPEGVTRKSFFAYFYTKTREDAVPYHDTIFKARPTESASKKIKTQIKENVKNTAKSTLKKLGVKF